MSKSIVIVGSCMIDLSSYATRLPLPGETICGKKFIQGYGGKGANQCISAAKLGASTSLIAALGSDDFGAKYLKVLSSENVDVSHVSIKENVNSGMAQILIADNGENCIVIVPGANDLLSINDIDSAKDVIKSASVLLCQFESCMETTLYALKLHKGHGISILNGAPAVENLNPELLESCTIFCVNEPEAEVMTGLRPLNLSNAQKAIDSLLEKGCNTIILTLGSGGAVFASKNERSMVHVPTEKVIPVDTTGAGDSFLGALAYFMAYHPTLSMKECIKRACQVATRSVLKPGTQASFPSRKELPEELFL
ncbi:ribokinase-like [Venturia canescens]|uniref:ribokinase-like n=1 Tax=Venturia canescens TaxID=32260 RepID=UPI001C9C4DB8|nr:ribokinase-like [Venturia canescens]